MSAPATGYDPVQVSAEELMLWGSLASGRSGWNYSLPSLPGTALFYEVQAMIGSIASPIDSPYATVTPYDPFVSGQPLYDLYTDLSSVLTDFISMSIPDDYATFLGEAAEIGRAHV